MSVDFSNIVEPGPFSREDICRYVGLTEAQLNSWLDRYQLFPPIGRGRVRLYGFADLVKIAALRAMVQLRVDAGAAAAGLRNYGVYGSALHNPATYWKEAGEFTLSAGKRDVPLVGVDSPDVEAVIKVRSWPIIFNLLTKIEADFVDKEKVRRFREAMTALHAERKG